MRQSESIFDTTFCASLSILSKSFSLASIVSFCVIKLTEAEITPAISHIFLSILAAQFAQSTSSSVKVFFIKLLLNMFNTHVDYSFHVLIVKRVEHRLAYLAIFYEPCVLEYAKLV